jgi:hypothetical protein
MAEFTAWLTGALSAITSGINNMSIKLSGGYTDNEYADALMREHRAALAKQGLTSGFVALSLLPQRLFVVDKPMTEAEAETTKAAFAATLRHWVSVTPPSPKPHSCDLPAWWRMEWTGKGDGSIWRCQCGQNYRLTADVGFVKITPEDVAHE